MAAGPKVLNLPVSKEATGRVAKNGTPAALVAVTCIMAEAAGSIPAASTTVM